MTFRDVTGTARSNLEDTVASGIEDATIVFPLFFRERVGFVAIDLFIATLNRTTFFQFIPFNRAVVIGIDLGQNGLKRVDGNPFVNVPPT